MPAAVHEYLASTVEAAIGWQLEVIRGGIDEIAMHVRKIRNCRSASIFLEDNTRRDPDSQFTYDGARWPPFVIEIANSQSKKDGGKNLPKLADQYITESSGNIQTVLGICLDYRGTKKATLSIWRSNYGVDQQGEYLAADEILVSQVYIQLRQCPREAKKVRSSVRQMEVQLQIRLFGYHCGIFYLGQYFFHLQLSSRKSSFPMRYLPSAWKRQNDVIKIGRQAP